MATDALFGTAGSLVDQALRMGALVDIRMPEARAMPPRRAMTFTGSDDEDGVTMPQVMTWWAAACRFQ